ncbi:hypothetical protein MVES1_001527 [Malassezia vespertilionis]|uniref:uncharacterized protein n=1 Tax=Malassezia vespertilionis TaxID=2020962 RepID=UPI0024B27BA2|nr:uncharacterized protein MVES1_001527 [Malassezia vespertilionis]WFD06185.1 hypothetical protein MVES1_001527 [Malassezia vespertilionis]
MDGERALYTRQNDHDPSGIIENLSDHISLYGPKCKYAIRGAPIPKFPSSMFGWIPQVFRTDIDDVLRASGTDAAVFLCFLQMMRWLFTVLAVLLCVVLVPVDIVYNVQHSRDTQKKGASLHDTTQPHTDDLLMDVTINDVDGSLLWAHVALSYLATLVALAFVYLYYKKVIQLRQAFFASPAYESNYYSRALMITEVPKAYQVDESFTQALNSLSIPYPFSETQLGYSMHNLPMLCEEQHTLVVKLESYLNTYVQSKRKRRPRARIDGHCFNIFGGQVVDAIDYYGEKLRHVEDEIVRVRSDTTVGEPMSYGFASLAAVPYAHAVARTFKNKRARGLRIRLACSPHDIIWKNLSMGKAERIRTAALGRAYLVLLFLADLIPLLVAAAISNLNSLAVSVPFLRSWEQANQFSFAAVSGILPALISGGVALFIPHAMRSIAIFRGVRTRESRYVALVSQYFGFLMLAQFLFFSLISVILDVAVFVLTQAHRHKSVGAIFSDLVPTILRRIEYRFTGEFGYWLTIVALKAYYQIFELAQVSRLFFVWVHKHFKKRTYRELWLFAKPPSFNYWIQYAELLFVASIGMIYAPLAPILLAFVAAVFWIASFVYKYQFVYVYVSKTEMGGRLWSIVVNRFLIVLGFMQVIIGIAVGFKQSWVKAVACVPPVLFVIAFRLYCHFQLEPKFLWYDPAPMELARLQTPIKGSDKERLARQFGHPFLHDPLWTPVVYSDMLLASRSAYTGRVQSDYDFIEQHRTARKKYSRSDSSASSPAFLPPCSSDAQFIASVPASIFGADASGDARSDTFELWHESKGTAPAHSDETVDMYPMSEYYKEWNDSVPGLAGPTQQDESAYPMPQFMRDALHRPYQQVSPGHHVAQRDFAESRALPNDNRAVSSCSSLHDEHDPYLAFPHEPTSTAGSDIISLYGAESAGHSFLHCPMDTPYDSRGSAGDKQPVLF